jgi:hypothetical protein
MIPGDDIFSKILIDEAKSESLKNYKGQLDNAGLRSGLGLSFFPQKPNTVEYEGKWKDGQKHGLGKLNYDSGYLWFDGEFDKNEFLKGEMYDVDSFKRYTGGFKDGKRSGLGKEYYVNGKLKYEGIFADDMYEGEGKYYAKKHGN